MSTALNIDVDVQPTPNPNALKFILNENIKKEGKSSYRSPMECMHLPLATALFMIRGVDQIHLFENVVTVTKFGYEEWNALEPKVRSQSRRRPAQKSLSRITKN